MKCAACGTELPEGASMCPQCGRPAEAVKLRCVSCGAELPEGVLLCPQCGRAVETADVVRQQAASRQLTKKEFYELPGMKACRNNIKSCAVILYVCAAITTLAALFWDEIPLLSVVDGVSLLLLGLWLQLGKSRVAAILITVYGGYNMFVSSLSTGTLRGWWIPLAGVWAITYTFKFYKMWSKYRKTGILPKDAVSG